MPPDFPKEKCVAESLGTFVLVFLGCGAIRVSGLYPGALSTSAVPIVFGLVVAAMIYALGHVSGAHFNPAVTFGFALVKRFPWKQVGVYWLSQMTGAFLAVYLLKILLPGNGTFGAVQTRLSEARTFGWETLLTFFLMLVIIAVATDSRAEGTMAGAAIGGIILVDACVGGPLTGAAMNPARFLAPAVMEGRLEAWWIYCPAAFLGAGLAAFLYEKIRGEPFPEERPKGRH